MERNLVWLGVVIGAIYAAATIAHALIYKRDVRSTIAWSGFILMVPFIGASLYWLAGINRIQRKAMRLGRPTHGKPGVTDGRKPEPSNRLVALATLGNKVTHFPLTAGNAIDPLVDGATAYPAMLDAIESATKSVALAVYIFDADETGEKFRAALAAAQQRGAVVRVLIDAVGGYRWQRRRMADRLRDAGVLAAEFLPVANVRRPISFNLRNHRKLLVVDGATAFTGGMNITGERLRDLQFRIVGPVVSQLQHVFADDWHFTTGESLSGDDWFPQLGEGGTVLARAVPDGPDDNFDVLRLLLLGAIAEARSTISIITPYFLPDIAVVSALNTAALRGVRVEIILPERSDNWLITWASRANLWQLLERGCRIWFSPPPFDHSKLMIVDNAWTLVGSTNWDPRSLRLNFELNVECFADGFARQMSEFFEARRNEVREITKAEMDGRSLPLKLRDGAARLLTPYL